MVASILLALLATASLAAAQPALPAGDRYISRGWSTPDGLPQNSVTSLAQSPDGYLWLGTFGGLVRFDGTSFTVFEPANTPGLRSARIVALLVDRRGALWVGTESGLTRYADGHFTSFTSADGFPAAGAASLLEDRRGRIWAGTGLGLVRFDGQRFGPVPGAEALVDTIAMAETPDGAVWASTWTLVAKVVDGAAPLIVQRSAGPDDSVRALLLDSKGRLWAGGSRGLQRWDGSTFVTERMAGGRRYGAVTALMEDASGTLWAGTWLAGLYIWRDGELEPYTAEGALSMAMIRAVAPDRHGQVWLGTDVSGLIRLKPRQVYNYQRAGRLEQSIGPIVGDGQDGLWIGATCGGLYHFRNGAFRVYSMADGNPHDCVWALHRDPDGTLWIGTAGGGLGRLADGRFTTWSEAQGLGQAVLGIARARDGTLWLGTVSGIARFDGGRFTNYGVEAGVHGETRAIMQDRRGTLWFGGPRGLTRLTDGVFSPITTAQGLSNEHVRAIHEDVDGVLWIGTYGGGLNRLKDGRFTAFTTQEGLCDNAVSRIIEDDAGRLWMSGNKGVYHVSRRQLNDFAEGRTTFITCVSYGIPDGMIIDETNGGQPAGWRTDDGRLWFPTIKGLVSIEPDATAHTHPPVYVERTVVNQRDAEFHFTAIDLVAPEKTRFRYRLAGYDQRWIDSGTRRTAFYTNIPPGDYRFEVIATNGDGLWSETPGTSALQVAPFWWELRRVQGAALALLLVVTGLVVRYISLRRERARVAELMREQALERERSRIARDLHDDLGSRLSHIALMAARAQTGQPDDRLATAARSAVQAMDELVWSVNARNDTVESFAYYVAQYAEEHIGAAGLRCRLALPDVLPARNLPADTRRHLFLAFKESINNALKHAQASEVRISLQLGQEALVLEVADNGLGLSAKAADPTGNGLSNLKERMDAVGGSLGVESQAGRGTKVTLTVPLRGHSHALAQSSGAANTVSAQ